VRGSRVGSAALLTPRWIAVHVAVVVLVAAFLALGWWQLGRAASGNLLSYGYTIQWPAFAAFVVWVWITEMRKAVRSAAAADPSVSADSSLSADSSVSADPAVSADPSVSAGPAAAAGRGADHDQRVARSGGSSEPVVIRRRRPRNEAAYDDSDDPQLAAYNHYLAWLNEHPYASPADYPGPPSKELHS
jgi:hypothetical protein